MIRFVPLLILLFVVACKKEHIQHPQPIATAVNATAASTSYRLYQTKINGWNALVYTPPGYNPSVPTPITIWLPGTEADGTEISRIYSWAVARWVNDPVYPARPKGIWVMLQSNPSAFVSPAIAKKMFDTILGMFNEDPARISLAGHSAGTYSWDGLIKTYPEVAAKVASVLYIGMVPYNNSFPKNYVDYKIKGLNICGNADPKVTTIRKFCADTKNQVAYVEFVGGHTGWNTFYRPDWKYQGLNVYDYLTNIKKL